MPSPGRFTLVPNTFQPAFISLDIISMTKIPILMVTLYYKN